MTQKLSNNQMSELKKNKENESYSNALVDPKTVDEPYPNPQK